MKNKNKIFVMIFCLCTVVLTNNAMAQKKNKPYFAVANEKMNILYAGIPNPVTIAASISPKKLRIDWGGATATSLGGGRYDVNIPSSFIGKEVTIEVRRGKTQNLGRFTFRVKPFPEPEVYVGANIVGGRIVKEVLLANPLVTARMGPEFNYHLRWNVLSYNVTFVINNIVEQPITVEGPHFSEEVKNKIIESPSGAIIVFSDFKIQSIAGYREIQKLIIIRIE